MDINVLLTLSEPFSFRFSECDLAPCFEDESKRRHKDPPLQLETVNFGSITLAHL